MTLINMGSGLVVTEHEGAKDLLKLMAAELLHWSACSSCLNSTTDHSVRHRAARLA